MEITVNFEHITGKIKPMHGVCQVPIVGWISDEMFHYLTEANIPYARMHDVGGVFGGNRFVDIHNVFRDFDADENDPASYDFVFTDKLFEALNRAGVEPIYRLGETIENSYRVKAYRIYPPKDYEKWARICEHIVRHYNEGWADGYHFGIKYWEIWNEPEGEKECHGGACFLGTQEEYFRLYEVTSKHLKKCFGDSIMVGGYASCGFSEHEKDKDLSGIRVTPYTCHGEHWIDFFHDFLAYISSDEHKAPLDFFSWHTYSQPEWALENEKYCRKVLAKYGFDDVIDIIDEWNTGIGREKRRTARAAVTNLSMMLAMQKTRTSMMSFYGGHCTTSDYAGLFCGETRLPLLSYYSFLAFGGLYKLGNEAESGCDTDGIYVCAAKDKEDEEKRLLVANPTGEEAEIRLCVSGADAERAEVFLLDKAHTLSPCGGILKNCVLTLPAESFAEIRFR